MGVSLNSDSDSCSNGYRFVLHGESDSYMSSLSASFTTTSSDELSPRARIDVATGAPVWQRRPVSAFKHQHVSIQLKAPPTSNPGTGLSIVESGQPGSADFAVKFYDSKGRGVSPLHHIPLYAGRDLWTMVCTTPKDSWIEVEVGESVGGDGGEGEGGAEWEEEGGLEEEEEVEAGRRASNEFQQKGCGAGPLKLRLNNGTPSHYSENSLWNIGMLPQTWANPELPNLEYGGLQYDGRPLEAIDLGSKPGRVGEVYAVKPLAAFAVIDWDKEKLKQQLSWKIVCIRADDLSAVALDDVGDVNRRMPGVLEEIREWLRICRCLQQDDRMCVFGLNERAANREGALRVVMEAHASWQRLVEQRPSLLVKSSPFFGVEGRRGEVGGSSPLPPSSPSSQSLLWQRISGPHFRETGGVIMLSDPKKLLARRQRRPWSESVCDYESLDTESQGQGSVSTNGTVSRRLGLKALRSSPLFAHPAYIEPRMEELMISFEGDDLDELSLRTSGLCFPVPGRRVPLKLEPVDTPRRKWPGGSRKGSRELGLALGCGSATMYEMGHGLQELQR